MIGVARWRLSLTWRTLRWVPPFLFELAVILILTASGGQPLDSTLAETAIATLFATAWLGVSHTGAERPSHTEVLDVAVGPGRRLFGTAWAAVPFLAVAAAVSIIGPLLVAKRTGEPLAVTIVSATIGQLSVAAVGYAIGAAAHRLGRGNRGWTVLLVLLGTTIVLARPSGFSVVGIVLPPVIDAARSVTIAEVVPNALGCIAWSLVILLLVAASYGRRTRAPGKGKSFRRTGVSAAS